MEIILQKIKLNKLKNQKIILKYKKQKKYIKNNVIIFIFFLF